MEEKRTTSRRVNTREGAEEAAEEEREIEGSLVFLRWEPLSGGCVYGVGGENTTRAKHALDP